MISKFNLAQTFDHTLLKPNATASQIEILCHEANQYHFKAVCVPPSYLQTVSKHLSESVEKCSVIGFPTGYQTSETKLFECKNALDLGATEIDTVINIGDLKNQYYDQILKELSDLASLSHNHDSLLKVIFETSELNDQEIIKVCQICSEAKVDFVKTSTGFSSSGAQLNHVILMKDHISEQMKIKASGGIRTLDQALSFIDAGAHRLGLSAGVSIMKEYEKIQAN